VANATGIFVPLSEFGLNFSTAGRVTEIDVYPGQQVKAGQLIARIDSGPQQAVVASDLASVSVMQAQLDRALNPLAPGEAAALQGQLAAIQGLNNDTAASIATAAAQDAAESAALFQIMVADQRRSAADGCTRAGSRSASQIHICDQDRTAIMQAQADLAAAQSRQQRSGLVLNQPQLDQSTVDLARNLGQLATDSVPVPAVVDEARARVATAQAQVQQAQADLARTAIVAPADATVIAVNGQVGEQETPQASGSQSAPGSTAPLPKPEAALPGAPPGSSTLGVSNNSFAVLGQPGELQAVVPFAEAEAGRLGSGQPGTLTADAVPGLVVPVHVVGVAPAATVIAGAVQYYATVALERVDPRLKNGMTANLSITVARAENVLAVPNRALYMLDGKPHVDVWFGGRPVPTEVAVGLAGSELTQINSGVTEGQQLVLSLRHPLPTSSAPKPTQGYLPFTPPNPPPYTNTAARVGAPVPQPAPSQDQPGALDVLEGPDPNP
jgi:multidrug efflux pump subunit AcrA (membrane-fusion protein)